ncbi:hypothetical protein [Nocardia cyriacigeorgica]|jgi:hypothetical protein|uniref:hypothetical protein n=1 Tax=Nocardia cyriacigeorgica TaxID=135487 RepID=UPI0002DE0DFB|nr:hypothetical protein [Nocardia cyriacigeorgica]
MSLGQARAIGLIRRGIPGGGHDLDAVARRHGCLLVFTVTVDTGPLVAALVVRQYIVELDADAVVVPGFEHADSLRHVVTDLAALITPMQIYPRGYRWSAGGHGAELTRP